ncbi:HEAT repeat domain-containing protein [Haloparvum sp. PAK95]|uniref:HEAT repeat domain-containing protein n=1 Tax=Haloparvum sp. PAK95 TaxID=3418962 RepID=UPI003D2F2886
MSNGDDEGETDDAASEAADTEAPSLPEETTAESLNEYLDAVADELEAAETEADLDDVDALIDDAESALADADLPEPEDEEEEDPQEALESRIEDLRSDVEDARGPYAEDVVADVEAAVSTIEESEWTETGASEIEAAVDTFANTLAETIDVDVHPESADEESLVVALESLADAVEDADLDPDEDAETIASLVDAVDTLSADLDAAEEWDDLESREKLQAQGYFDVLGHYKDYPVEWAALKAHEREGNTDMVLLALDMMGSDFMERRCLEALERMGKKAATEEAIQTMLDRAGKRDEDGIRILGKMAADEATETLLEYVDEDSDPGLQKVTFKALGEIGAEDAVQPLANKLEMDNEHVRPLAARALGLIGDTRAVDPLAETLDSDESDEVRAAAAWALRQIGTQEALEIVAEYTDERVFIVQTEAQKASEALDAAAQPA